MTVSVFQAEAVDMVDGGARAVCAGCSAADISVIASQGLGWRGILTPLKEMQHLLAALAAHFSL